MDVVAVQQVADDRNRHGNRERVGFRVTEVLTEREGNVLFNDAFDTFCLRLYGVGHIVKDHSDSERKHAMYVCM